MVEPRAVSVTLEVLRLTALINRAGKNGFKIGLPARSSQRLSYDCCGRKRFAVPDRQCSSGQEPETARLKFAAVVARRIKSRLASLHEELGPQVTFAFWLIKISATTLGETSGDALSMTLNLGYARPASPGRWTRTAYRPSFHWVGGQAANNDFGRIKNGQKDIGARC